MLGSVMWYLIQRCIQLCINSEHWAIRAAKDRTEINYWLQLPLWKRTGILRGERRSFLGLGGVYYSLETGKPTLAQEDTLEWEMFCLWNVPDYMSFQIVFMAKIPLGPPYKSFISCLQISQFKTLLLSSLPSALNTTHTIRKIAEKNEKALNTMVQLKK